MSVRTLNDGTRWSCHNIVRVSGQATAEEGGAQVDGDAGEPDHEQGEHDALVVVPRQEADVLRSILLRKYRGAVQNRRQHSYLRKIDILDFLSDVLYS